jgi:polyhydroxybutyrate depolymerase
MRRFRGERRVMLALVLAGVVGACGSGRAGNRATSATARAAPTAASSTTTIPADCTPARPAQSRTAPLHFSFHGNDRTYLLALPREYDGKVAVPLVFSLGGFGATAQAHEANTSMGKDGTARGFAVVTPAALGSPTSWNIFGAKDKPDDFAFVHALVADVERHLCVDRSRVYAIGYSNGSAFAGFLTCTAPYEFAAVAMVEATTPAGCPKGVAPSVLAIAGTADAAVLYNGGTGQSKSFIPPAPATVKGYAQRYDCASAAEHDEPIAGVQRTRYHSCVGGAEVVLDTVVGGTHDYPGGLVAAHDHVDSAAGRKFPATDEILQFFARHRRTWTP